MSEVTAANALETAIERLDSFSASQVVQNDYSIFDAYVGNSPYVIISTADSFRNRMDSAVAQARWEIGLMLAVEWTGWGDSLTNFRTYRQEILDGLNADGIRTPEAGMDITEIRSLTGIVPRKEPYVENPQESDPIFIFQDMAVVVEEF